MAYALKWVYWSNQGFPKDTCPWKNASEMKKHKPKLEDVARSILNERLSQSVYNANSQQVETHIITSIRFDDVHTFVGDIEGYTGAVWYSPTQGSWMMSHHPLERKN